MQMSNKCELCGKEKAVLQWHIYIVCLNCYIKKKEQEREAEERRRYGK